MIGASKILTVSYGTFSCTLEGFEEPFNTMKAIAEYFRDLAAEDRYFGAEPPTPDAAMLHRIAEREIQRRVEAKIEDNAVHLRAADPKDASLAVPTHSPAPMVRDAAPAAASAVEKLSRIRAAKLMEAFADPAPAPAPAPSSAMDDFAEDEHAEEAPVITTVIPEAEVAAPDDASPAPQAAVVASSPVVEDYDADFDADLTATLGGNAALAPQDTPGPAPVEERHAVVEDAEAALPPAMMAAEITDQGAVDQAPAEAAAPETRDSIPLADHGEDDVLLARIGASASEAPEAAPVADAAAAEDPQLAEDIALAASAPAEAQVPVADAAAPASGDEAMLAPPPAPVEPERATVAEADGDAHANPAGEEPEGMAAQAVVAEETAPLAAAEPIVDPAPQKAPETGEKLQRARARVIKIRRADTVTVASIDAGPVKPATVQPQRRIPAPKVAAAPRNVLSDEAEAALQAELAALEAETSATDAPVGASVSEPLDPSGPADITEEDALFDAALAEALNSDAPLEPVAAPESGEAVDSDVAGLPAETEIRRKLTSDSDDADMSRLIAQTNTAMDGPETKRRQSAIAHLKAAVAATVADRQIQGNSKGTSEKTRTEPYREDLERVVRTPLAQTVEQPDRAPAGPTETTPPNRLGLLVLVSEQRIDRPKPVPEAKPSGAPVRPRRISSGLALKQAPSHDETEAQGADMLLGADTLNVFAETQSFSDFAESLGARNLAELMEAAAVYTAHLQGQPKFNRRVLMRHLAELPDLAEVSREDSLNTFGTLLRQGSFALVEPGSYALTDRSAYLAEFNRFAG